jgi:hypothetical protein
VGQAVGGVHHDRGVSLGRQGSVRRHTRKYRSSPQERSDFQVAMTT